MKKQKRQSNLPINYKIGGKRQHESNNGHQERGVHEPRRRSNPLLQLHGGAHGRGIEIRSERDGQEACGAPFEGLRIGDGRRNRRIGQGGHKMTTLYVTAKINDSETGELIEKVEFLYSVDQVVEDMGDLSQNDLDFIEDEIDRKREYERRDGDLYRVDMVVLQDGDEEEDDSEDEG